MAAVISTGSAPKLLWPGVNQIFGDMYNTYKGEYSEIFTTSLSDKRFEEDLQMVNMGLAVPKDEGSAIQYDTFKQGYVKRYVHIVYGKGFVITREALDDNQYSMSLAARGAQMLANSLAQTKEIIGANILNNAFDTNYAGGDGKPLLATDHPLGAAGGTFSNKLSTAADLSEASVEAMIIQIMNLVDDAGLRIALRPMKLIVPTDLNFEACRLLKSTGRVGTADNDINAIESMSAIPGGYVVNHYLTDTDAWFIKVGGLAPNEGMRHFQRAGYDLEMDNDFDTKNLLTTATERYSFGWSNSRAMVGSAGA